MSSVIVDGYNLIGVSHSNLEREREKLIGALIEYRKKKGHDVTVVFDGWKTGELRETRYVTGGVRVIYSRVGEKADSVIKRIIASERREWIVATSDREIADRAWSTGSIPIAAAVFLAALEREAASVPAGEDEDEDPQPRRKGNPRRLSKKEKALRRALSKL